jgi:hypothetical protein
MSVMTTHDEIEHRPNPWVRLLLLVVVVGVAAFWIWALFFASKTAVNKIGDDAWAERAEAICADYDLQVRALSALADADLDVRADLVDESTGLLSAMLDEIVVVPPQDDKGQAIVPAWVEEYRILLADRYRYADQLRSGQNIPFTETAVNGVPVTERLETFAGDNDMPSCAPPRGSIV